MKNKLNKLNQIIKVQFYLFLTVLFLASCSDQVLDTAEEDQEPVNEELVQVKNGYLHFKDVSAFSEITSLICNMTDEEREEWEEEQNFLSQRRIMSEVIKAEDEFEEECIVKYDGVDVSNLPDSLFKSVLYKKYLAKNVIKEVNQGTEEQYYDLAIYNVSMIDFVNEDGFFAIGDSLYHVDAERLVVLVDGSFKKELVKSATSMSASENVTIIDSRIQLKSTNWRSPGWIYPSSGQYKEEGKQRIGLKVLLDVKLFIVTTPAVYEFYHDVHVKIQKKNWRGQWKYETTGVWLDGNWEMSIFRNPLILTNSYSWQGNANYLKVSVNPSTGSVAPYQSYFSISSPNPYYNDDDYSPIYTDYYWKATRWGGAAGITKIMQD